MFIIDKEVLNKGLIIFRRGDVLHREFYCRVRVQHERRYKTVALKTEDRATARELAHDAQADIRFRVKHDVAIFNRSFHEVAEEYLATMERRLNIGEVSLHRFKNLKSRLYGVLDQYIGSKQVHLITQDEWKEYPSWRRETGKGRIRARISDSTIGAEMAVFNAVMNFAIQKRYVPSSHRFEGRPKLKGSRRDEFTVEEYRKLHSFGRAWMKKATTPQGVWYRTMCYNFILIMCNTGMRPVEAKNLRWRDVTTAQDRDKRDIVVLFVQGKDKSRKLVAPASVGDYLDRVRSLSKATKPDDFVFTIINGKPAKFLYCDTVEALLEEAGLRIGPGEIPRTTYCFRHTYATMRLSEGVDVYILAEQMGTSVKMIEQHYGHVNTIKHADRVLMGMTGWELVREPGDDSEAAAKAAKAAASRDRTGQAGRTKTRSSKHS
jgi:integrase